MHCKYETTIICSCPVDDLPDVYVTVFESRSIVKVEDILTLTKGFVGKKMFQEDLTVELSRMLNCSVTTIGVHSGVLTTVNAP